ncbi:hypothetical protein A5893_09895 [Pedobacter psychrophilus]|uniref:Septum formation inhibitor Maf n=1 Tax=Pedobacter psychrophilus TaxID=1826909 RepID=A0A179DFS0_9SPHI|nr:hypothetical protein [Pedobacter psychrophilus]OAQ39871.1 hypothetical protein A5893_09895 [Pedobacter psychrophilus]
MKFYPYLVISILLVACTDQSSSKQEKPSALSQNFNKDWANNKLWYDGLAEVATYDAQKTVYKKQRNFDYTYITVAEDFNKEFRVKTDDYKRKDLYKVMKLNAFASIKTDNYPYHYLSSMFFYFDKPWEMDKMTTSSQEWCGNTYKEYLNNGNQYVMNYHSYFDNEGDGEKNIATENLFEDQLSYTLRSLNFKAGLSFDANILESQITNKVGNLEIYKAKLNVSDGNNDILAQATWKVTVTLEPNKTNVYYFQKSYPNLLLKQNTWDGLNLTLKQTSRYAYWQH